MSKLDTIYAANPLATLPLTALIYALTNPSTTDDDAGISVRDFITQIMSYCTPINGMLNGKLSVTVASSDLVIAIKTLAGGNPSASDPVYVNIGGTVRTISAALSITLADGTNWFNAGGTELATLLVPYFAYLVWDSNSSIVALSIARKPHFRLVSEGNGTTTSENHIYGHAGLTSTDDMVNIGRFEATLSAGAGYTWTVPTFTSANLLHVPTYESEWMTWTPVITGFSSNPTLICRYRIVQDKVEWIVHSSGVGTSNAVTATITLPLAVINITNLAFWCVGRGQDNGAEVTCTFRTLYNTNVMDAYKGPGNTAWTNSGTKYFSGQGRYQTA